VSHCAICDVKLTEESTHIVRGKVIRDAIEFGLRPPAGKLARTAEMIKKSGVQIRTSEKLMEQQWVKHFLDGTDRTFTVCKSCKERARDCVGPGRAL